MLSINTNLSSLIAQNSLNASTFSLNQAIERMSTGCKINHAGDNAANYSISNNMSTKLSSFEVAQDNVASGMDLVSVASDNLSLISDHASRIRDLCIQAHNGTYGEQSIKAIKSEANARISEIVRLYNTAEYNGINLLNKVESEVPADMPKAGASGFIDEDFERITPDVIVTDPTQLADAIAHNSTIGIGNAETLAKLAELVNSGTTCSGKTITLTEDIDLSAYSTGEGWTPIGNEDYMFQGTFDGQGHKVKNLYINRPDSDCQGLFGYVLYGGELKNVGIENCNVTGCYTVGGLAGYCETITNSYATGNMTGNDFVGGLAGFSVGDITNSYATGNVTGNNDVGGLVGSADVGTITNSYATGNVTGNDFVGGLAGYCYDITNSYATGNVTGNDFVGGLAGGCETITNSISYAEKVTGSSNVGSFCGEGTPSNITNCKTTEIEGLNKLGNTDEDVAGITYLPKTSTILQVGINSDDSCQITFNTDFSFSLINSLKNLDVTNSSSLDFIDNFLNKVSEKQTELGAVQNRLDSAAESISVNIENLTKSRSTLRDADIAKESSEYIKAQILQEASATLLSTANQSPAIALQLI